MYVVSEIAQPRMAGFGRRGALVRAAMTASSATPFEHLIIAIGTKRDRSAFTTLFAHYAPLVKAYLQKTGMGSAVAEEMTQDVLLTVWHKAAQFDPSRASANAWIFGIARNLRVDAQRRSRLVIPLSDPSEDAPPAPLSDALLAAAQSARAVRDAIDTLPAEQVAILRLAFFEDFSHGEIERRLAVPLGTVKSRLRLAMAKLRLALKDEP